MSLSVKSFAGGGFDVAFIIREEPPSERRGCSRG
jgi:hypothetical protein